MAQGVLGDSKGWGYPVGPRCYDQHIGLNLAGNDADIAAMPRPSKFPRWNFKWKLGTYPASGRDGTSEPVGGTCSPPVQQSLAEEGVA